MSLKVAPQETNEDLCQTSIDILIEKCTDWFRRNEINGPLWFADSSQPFPYQNDQTINIVLFGGFLKRYLESGNWDFSKAQFWVLSQSVKDVLSQLLGLGSEHIAVIPRYELFPANSDLRPFPRAQEPTTFVFAGRISAVKNIKMLLETVSLLQMEYNCPVQLALIGNYDNQVHLDRGRFDIGDYQSEIENLIQELPWKMQPSIVSKVGSAEWPLMKFTNPVYVNLSTFMCEDFDVSTAQVQTLGWPCFLSDWGGHQEVIGSNVVKIAPSMIAHDHEPAQVCRIKAKALAKSISEMSLRRTQAIETPVAEPQAISQGELDACRRAFISKYKDGISLAYREGLDHFADTPTGKKFFASYRAFLSGSSEQHSSHCVLINDLHLSDDPNLADAFEICRSIIEQSKEPVKFISLRDLFAADSLKAVAVCDTFILPFFTEELRSVIANFTKLLRPQKLIVYGHHAKVSEELLAQS